MPISGDEFKLLLRQFAAGVTIVTFSEGGRKGGLTVSSFSSVSLDPPLVSICVARHLASHDPIARSGAFAVNICTQDQGKLAWDFASGKIDKHALLESVEHTTSELGNPLITGSAARIDCKLVHQFDGGDHTIFVGQVEGGGADDDAETLLFFRGRMGRFEPTT